ncbi:hypothetical protein L843_4957 [Mycobacterium intracellulare MIN_061107_1834]|nr:hypothetical protein L843_4957 [Mycobacterium intracellulare MIN_061107_1834]
MLPHRAMDSFAVGHRAGDKGRSRVRTKVIGVSVRALRRRIQDGDPMPVGQ